MIKKILFIRTYRPSGTGGPLPPVPLLYLSSSIMRCFKDKYILKILDSGIGNLSLEEIQEEINDFGPDIVCLSSLAWEADLAHKLAFYIKSIDRNIPVLCEGQLASLVKGYLLSDNNIDYVIIGEGEDTIVELLEYLENGTNAAKIDGIAYRENGAVITNAPRASRDDLDNLMIDISAWDLIDLKEYSKYYGWNGALKEKHYIPILSSRGCPFGCVFCSNREIFGKRFRARSPQNVFSEIMALYNKYGIKEIHFFDAVFNYDIERAKAICRLIIESGINFSLAFPHGLRIDIMTDELLELLRNAGTYKLVYGIETASPRLQSLIGKNLNIKQAEHMIKKTSASGIIVGGYFMFGFQSETPGEMLDTVDFAARSDLDLAYFFKLMPYNEIIKFYRDKENIFNSADMDFRLFENFGYYSKEGNYNDLPDFELNGVILQAQQKFYLNIKRLRRNFLKFPHKIEFIKNYVSAIALIIQSYLVRQLEKKAS